MVAASPLRPPSEVLLFPVAWGSTLYVVRAGCPQDWEVGSVHMISLLYLCVTYRQLACDEIRAECGGGDVVLCCVAVSNKVTQTTNAVMSRYLGVGRAADYWQKGL